MFRHNFGESNTGGEPIVLQEIDSAAFKVILDSVFTGELAVNSENILSLLRTNDFLQLRSGFFFLIFFATFSGYHTY